MKTIVAIDPGVTGGIAVWGYGKTECHSMPETEGDRVDFIKSLKAAAPMEGGEVVCVLEKVGGYAGKGQPGSAMFVFGENFGFLKGVIQALEIRLELVRPQEWQKGLGLGTASACGSKPEWKNKLKAEAQRRFPQLTVTGRTADALLLLDYAVRKGI